MINYNFYNKSGKKARLFGSRGDGGRTSKSTPSARFRTCIYMRIIVSPQPQPIQNAFRLQWYKRISRGIKRIFCFLRCFRPSGWHFICRALMTKNNLHSISMRHYGFWVRDPTFCTRRDLSFWRATLWRVAGFGRVQLRVSTSIVN